MDRDFQRLKGIAETIIRHPDNLIGIESNLRSRFSPEAHDIILATLKGAGWANLIRLQKMAFIAEVDYIENTGQRLSSLEFRSWNFGPYSRQLNDAVYGMKDDIDLREQSDPINPSGRETILTLKDFAPVGALDDKRLEFVEISAGTCRYVATEALIRRSKSHDIYKGTPFRDRIDFEKFAREAATMLKKMDKSEKLASLIRDTEKSRINGKWKTYPTCSSLLRSMG